MGKITSYNPLLQAALALTDLFVIEDITSPGVGVTKNLSVEEMNKYWATVLSLATAAGGGWDFIQSSTPTALGADETWIRNTDGFVYKSNGAGAVIDGNWIFQFVDQLGLVNIDQGGAQILRSKTIQDLKPFPYYYSDGTGFITIPDNNNLDFGTNDFSILINFKTSSDGTLVHKRLAAGVGFSIRVSGGKVLVIYSGGSQFTLTGLVDVDDNENHSILILFDRSGNMSICLDGVFDSVTTAIDTTSIDNAENVFLFKNDLGAVLIGEISKVIFFNRLLTTSEAISLPSNPNKAIDWKDEGGSDIDIIIGIDSNFGTDVGTATIFNATYTNFVITTSVTASVLSNVLTTQSATVTEAMLLFNNLVVGKRYRYILNISALDNPLLIKDNSAVVIGNIPAGVQLLVFEFIATTTAVFLTAATAISTTLVIDASAIDNSVKQLGATLNLKPKDFSQIQAKDSANKNDGLVTTVTLHNKSLDHVYQDVYRAIADNDTFIVPVGCAFLEILINVTTLQAAQTIRVGTTNGGQEVVADSTAPATVGMKRLTVLIDGFSAGDTLYIGSDGGSGWTTLVADIYIRYQLIQV